MVDDGSSRKSLDLRSYAEAVEVQDRAEKGGANEAPHPASTVHSLTEQQHDRETVRRLFETGEYPYRKKMKRPEYEKRKAELQVAAQGPGLGQGNQSEGRPSLRGP